MRKLFYLTLLFLIGITASIHAHVIIGSVADPHKSAVLDLQSDGNRGLLLPKVALSNVTVFDLENDAEKITAYGMVVYNTNPDIIGGNGEGVYLWDGTKWMPVFSSLPAVPPIASDNGNILCSGDAASLYLDGSIGSNNANNYIWTLDDVEVGRGTTYTATAAGTYIVYYKEVGSSIRSAEFLLASSGLAAPTVTLNRNSESSDHNSVVTYTASIDYTPATSYEWTITNATLQSGGGNTSEAVVKFTNTGAATVEVAVSNVCGTGMASHEKTICAYPTLVSPSDNTVMDMVVIGQTTDPVSATFSSGTPTAQYQWYKSATNAYAGAAISGATSSSYEFAPEDRGAYYYYCAVSNADCPSSALNSGIYKATVYCGAKTSTDPDPETWLVFQCHNLGADETLDPFTYVEGNADGSGGTLGYLYQWGTKGGNSRLRNSATTTTKTTATTRANFILITDGSNPKDWRNPQLDTLWGDGTTAENPKKATDDPCDAGWKIPSKAQWDKVIAANTRQCTTSTSSLSCGCKIGKGLFLPGAGYRNYQNGTVGNLGYGNYWTSTVDGNVSYKLLTPGNTTSVHRAYGNSVRCVIDK